MSYIGENEHFSFRDSSCEILPNAAVSSAEAAELGRTLSRFFSRFSVGCMGFERLPVMYALCSGISECGRDVYACENTDMPSFRFGLTLLSAECGIFISESGGLKFTFFNKSGFGLPDKILEEIMKASPAPASEHTGRINSVTSFRSIYINNVADSLGRERSLTPAGISCGNAAVRSLWLEFFSGDDNELVFQISDDGQRVNAYSTELGFISFEKLTLAYCLTLIKDGKNVWLPEDFHYAADNIDNAAEKHIMRFNRADLITDEGGESRFLRDPLYMCTHLAKSKESLLTAVRNIPSIASAKREITVADIKRLTESRTVSDEKGRVVISRSGKSRVTLVAQSLSAETASELCAFWTERIRKIGSCGTM